MSGIQVASVTTTAYLTLQPILLCRQLRDTNPRCHYVHTMSSLFLETQIQERTWYWRQCVIQLRHIIYCCILFGLSQNYNIQPDGMLKRLTVMLRIREVSFSNLSPETWYPDWGFSWFSSVTSGECQDRTFLPNPFQCIIQLTTLYSTSYRLRH
jgi:hypothetical protein